MKKAIVVGASSGIGRELALILSQKGYAVGVMARRIQLLNELRNELQGELFVKQIDVMDAETAMRTLANFIEEMGGADLVVISAATGDIYDIAIKVLRESHPQAQRLQKRNGADHSIHDLNWRLEKEIIGTNVTGFAAVANVAIHHFMERGSGHLVGISSIAALRGGRRVTAYNASKAFVSNYMEGLRQKVTRLRLPITITDVKPGYVKTAMAKGDRIFWAAPVDVAAMQIYDAIKQKKSHAYITHRWRLIAWLLKVLPDPIYRRL